MNWWESLRFSLLISLSATALVAVIGIPLAFALARRRFAGKVLLEAALTLPLVLPPTVVGYGLIVLLGRHGWLGGPLGKITGGFTLLFHPVGAVLAAALVSFPLLYLPAQAAFANVDRELDDLAKLLGANGVQRFWRVSLPLARRGIASGLLLCFARSLGEFGATLMVLGDLPAHRTLPIAIYDHWIDGQLGQAAPAVWGLCGISLAVVLIYNQVAGRQK